MGSTLSTYTGMVFMYLQGRHGAKQADLPKFDDEAIEKWLREGIVRVNVKRVQMLGPPGSGKTCSLRLLLNENPPNEAVTDSTPITCRAVKAARISSLDGRMERVDVKALLSRLACDLKEAAAENKSAQDVMSKTEPKRSESSNDLHSSKILQDIVEAIPKAKANLNCHWVYVIDSGGQAAFQELLPLFTRASSLNIITLDLSKGMDEKLDLPYRIKEKQFSNPNFSATNLEFLKDVLSSGAILQPYSKSNSKNDDAILEPPEYFVLGTHKDDKEKVTPQKIAEFNEALSLLASGSEEKGYRIIRAKLGETEIIYPVNTILDPGRARQEESKKLCTTLFGFFDDASDSGHIIELPVRWFAFELALLEKASDENFLEMDDVLSIGESLQMNEGDTKLALEYLHNYTIILYYPQVLPDIVFVDPHPILDILSRLLALTYNIERKYLHLLTKQAPLDSELENLKKRGIFAMSLLNKLKDDHKFSKSDFIKLLHYLHIIVDTQDGYFIPSALPSYAGPPPESDVINPILIVWQNPINKEILPVPRGIFPLAVVNLMKLNQPQFQFPPDSEKYLRYQDAMSFRVYVQNEHIGTIHFIKKHRHIEIYFTGHKDDASKYCPLICEAVTEAIHSSSVNIHLKPLCMLAFACSFTKDCEKKCYHIITNEAEEKVECTLCPKRAVISGQEKYWSWIHVTQKSSTEVNDAHHYLDITCLRDVRSSLKESKFLKSKWLDLGDQLGLLPDTLDVIETNHSADVSRCLRETLIKWLAKADNASPSWGSLVKALEAIEQNNVAEHIRCTRIKRKIT